MTLLSGLLLVSCMCVSAVNSVTHLPVLLWSTESSAWTSAPAISDGQITSSHELYRLLQRRDASRTRTLVMFLQDTLSIDDFTYYSTVYGSHGPLHNVQNILESFPASLVLPAVEKNAIDNLPGHLNKQAKWNEINVDNLNVSSMELDTTKPNLIIIRLQSIPRADKMSAAMAFSENDKYIGRITQELMERGIHFDAIFTGMKPSKVDIKFDMVHKQGRGLLATTTDSYPPLNVTNGTSTCILFYATQIQLNRASLNFDLTNKTFGDQMPNTNFSECTTSNATLSLFYSSPGQGLSSLELRFVMSNMFYTGSARNWFRLDSVIIIQNGDILNNATFNTTYASAPEEYSFHCQQVGTQSLVGEVLIPINDEAAKWNIFISEFQIQAFNVHNNLFSYASDCTSFFTPAIWMGLVSLTVLLWILSYGIFMIMQLTTNDRFDDPKGQALSVPQGD